jgi:hypothetical protein
MPDRKTALFIGINQRYINPTNSLLPAVVQGSCNVHFYGPGFVSQATLERGVDRYVDALGSVDLIVVTAQCVIGLDAARLSRYLTNYTALLNDGRVTTEYLNDVRAFCKKHKQRVVCGISEIDPHVTPQWILDSLLEHASYFMSWGKGSLNSSGDMEAVNNEEYIQIKLKRGFKLGLMDDFAVKYRQQFINLGQFVGVNEFYWGALAARKYDVSVPGSRYARRQAMSNVLAKLDGVRVRGTGYRYAYKIAQRLGLRPYANFYLVHLYNLAFQRVLSQSKVCVTEGGANNYPVRKFFEIPAAGALMVCWPAVGMESLGFKDGLNCIFVRDEEGVAQTIKAVVRDVDQFEAIAAAGRDLVFRQHSVSARAVQLHEAIQRIEDGTFKGSSWQDGCFQCVAE